MHNCAATDHSDRGLPGRGYIGGEAKNTQRRLEVRLADSFEFALFFVCFRQNIADIAKGSCGKCIANVFPTYWTRGPRRGSRVILSSPLFFYFPTVLRFVASNIIQ